MGKGAGVMMVSGLLAGVEWKGTVNALCRPEWVLTMAAVVVLLGVWGYRWWTRPALVGALGVMVMGLFAAALMEPSFRGNVTRPDNIAIVGMVAALGFFLWVGLRRAAVNDDRLERGLPVEGGGEEPRTYVWPDLVYIELICLVAASVGLIVWSILVKAPLEQPADPGHAPNPAKAPWYFLGLQELLVYFDPWMAGVVYPALIVFGLCALPFVDRKGKGNGYYTLKDRRWAVGVWLFGFVVLWVVPIVIGTFLRGPNWSFFGPFEPWDANRHEAVRNVDLSQWWWEGVMGRARPTAEGNPLPWMKHWLVREWVGLVLVGGYLVVLPIVLRWTVLKGMYKELGRGRYGVVMVLLLMMGLVPIKMMLRWTVGLKYLVYLPELNASL